jgi:hypothetical protein
MLGSFSAGRGLSYFVSVRLLTLTTFLVLIESFHSLPDFNVHGLVHPLRSFLSARMAALLAISKCASLEYEHV